MTAQGCEGGIESGVRDSLDSDGTVVEGILDEVFYSVIGIRHLIRTSVLGDRTDVLVLPFAEESSPDALVYDYVPVPGEFAHLPREIAHITFPVRSDAIWGSGKDYGMLLPVQRFVNDCAQGYPVPHRNHHFFL